MISILPGYPDDVLAVSASGRVSARDYREVLVPQAMARLERGGEGLQGRVETYELHEGVPEDSERADVIAYLNSLSEHPAPLPTASK